MTPFQADKRPVEYGCSYSEALAKREKRSKEFPANFPLPDEVLQIVFQSIPTGDSLEQTRDLLEVRRVCKRWYKVFSHCFESKNRVVHFTWKRRVLVDSALLSTFLRIFEKDQIDYRKLRFRLVDKHYEWKETAEKVESALSRGSSYFLHVHKVDKCFSFFVDWVYEYYLHYKTKGTFSLKGTFPLIVEQTLLNKRLRLNCIPPSELDLRYSPDAARRHLLARCASSSSLPSTEHLPTFATTQEFFHYLQANGIDFKSAYARGLQPIHLAVAFGNAKLVKLLIEEGTCPQVEDAFGNNLLHYAVCFSSFPFVLIDTLIAKGVNLHKQNREEVSKTPFHLAILKEDLQCVQHIVTRYGYPSLRTNFSPLYFACHITDFKILDYLLESGAAEGQGKLGLSGTLIAILETDTLFSNAFPLEKEREAFKYLIERGADIDFLHRDDVTRETLTPLLLTAVFFSKKSLFRFLIENGATNGEGYADDQYHVVTAFLITVFDLERLQLLLDKVTDIDRSNKEAGYSHHNEGDDKTPLHVAITTGRFPHAQTLIARGANVNTVDEIEGDTPLIGAILEGHEEMVRLLISHGVDLEYTPPKEREESPDSPLMIALREGKLEIAKLLIRGGANGTAALPIAADWGNVELQVLLMNQVFREPPLITAIREGNREKFDGEFFADTDSLIAAIRYRRKEFFAPLLAKGAPINGFGEEGFTPLTFAIRKGNREAVDFLLANGVDVNAPDGNGFTPLTRALQGGGNAMVNRILDAGANPNQFDGNGNTPLFLATKNGRRNYVQLLLERGADPTMQDAYGWNAWDWVFYLNYGGLLQCFLDLNLDIHVARDKYLSTPLIWASRHRYIETVKYLLAKGADLSEVDADGRTALEWATENGHLGVVTLLSQSLDRESSPRRQIASVP